MQIIYINKWKLNWKWNGRIPFRLNEIDATRKVAYTLINSI